MADGDATAAPARPRLPANLVEVHHRCIEVEIEMKVDVDIVAFREVEDSLDLGLWIGVGVGAAAEDVGALLQCLDEELIGARIVQEALSNVVRHAGATRARVLLEGSDARMVVTVEDDGRGFETREQAESGGRGLGLVGMAERARFLGGRVAIESASGRGTRVTVEVPRASGASEE